MNQRGMPLSMNNLLRVWAKPIRYLGHAVGQTILPRCCKGCGNALSINERELCALCWRGMQEAIGKERYCRRCGANIGEFVETKDGCNYCRDFRLRYDRLARVGIYKGPLAEMIRRLKFGGRAHTARLLGELLWQAVQGARMHEFDLVTWVPLHWWRKWNRTYNQAELLARRVGGLSGRPCQGLLRKTRWTAPQTHLSRQGRLANVRGSFGLRRMVKVDGKRVLLVDDVLTTGATASEAASTLRDGGAEVWVAVVGVTENR